MHQYKHRIIVKTIRLFNELFTPATSIIKDLEDEIVHNIFL